MVIERVIANIKHIDIGSKHIDNVWVTHEDLLKPHQKLVSESGRILKISLDDGQKLKNGDILYENDESVAVLTLKAEKVFEIIPKNNMEWAKAAFNIGNMHQKLYIFEDKLCVPYDNVLERVIKALNVEWHITETTLNGLLANVNIGSSHSHSHSHTHSHEHSHGHSHQGGHNHE